MISRNVRFEVVYVRRDNPLPLRAWGPLSGRLALLTRRRILPLSEIVVHNNTSTKLHCVSEWANYAQHHGRSMEVETATEFSIPKQTGNMA